MKLSWNKCKGGIWCSLNTVDLEDSHFDGMEGVYVIWHDGQTPKTVRVDQGIIRDRLAAHRTDKEIQFYSNLTAVRLFENQISVIVLTERN
jgi:hypothetical protein